MTAYTLPTPAELAEIALSADDDRRLRALFTRGTPENTQRAYRTDYGYIRAWRLLRFQTDMTWPEDPSVAMAYLLDHSEDLSALPLSHPVTQSRRRDDRSRAAKVFDRPCPVDKRPAHRQLESVP